MKVVRNTPDQLVLANRPWLLGLGLILFILIFVSAGVSMMQTTLWGGLGMSLLGGGMGVIAFAAFVRRTQLILDRTNDRVVLRRRSVFGYSEVVYPLNELTSAMVDGSVSSKGSTTRRAVLHFEGGMSAGIHPITLVYTSGPGPKRAARAINEWLKHYRNGSG